MEIISQEETLDNTEITNACIIASFMEIFVQTKRNNNEKWIKLFSEFWQTIKDVPLERESMATWYQLGDLIELNLTEDWKDDTLEWTILEYYLYNSIITTCGFHYPAKFEEYKLYFQERYWQDEVDKEPYYDSEEEREERLHIRIERGRNRDRHRECDW